MVVVVCGDDDDALGWGKPSCGLLAGTPQCQTLRQVGGKTTIGTLHRRQQQETGLIAVFFVLQNDRAEESTRMLLAQAVAVRSALTRVSLRRHHSCQPPGPLTRQNTKKQQHFADLTVSQHLLAPLHAVAHARVCSAAAARGSARETTATKPLFYSCSRKQKRLSRGLIQTRNGAHQAVVKPFSCRLQQWPLLLSPRAPPRSHCVAAAVVLGAAPAAAGAPLCVCPAAASRTSGGAAAPRSSSSMAALPAPAPATGVSLQEAECPHVAHVLHVPQR